ncbi:MAG: zinc ribbon domain-containing protein [Anaerovoracaceae bacterium]
MYITGKANSSGKTFGGTMMMFFGYVIGIIGVLGLITMFSNPDLRKNIVLIIAFIALGAFMIFRSKKNRKLKNENGFLAKKFNSYFCKEKNGTIPLAKLSDFMEIPQEDMKIKLEKLIEERYLINVHVDNNTNMVVLNRSTTTGTHKIKEIACPNCGALNTISSGQTSECEYCGTKLK